MLMNPELEGIVAIEKAPARFAVTSSGMRRVRFLMTALPVPLYCVTLASLGIEDLPAGWILLLTPIAMLWYAVDYFLHKSLLRKILKEVAHYGLFITPAIALFVSTLQRTSEAWPLAKGILFWGELACCSILVLVLWRNRQVEKK